ncbi:hypothetical protein [Methanococcoides burtonii]|uniref:Uncharacterized protein n=1 Tax=Methanococcoides burtonii (strain DSM 6242 / NBRC 107633 / OCM 468 / ACE-M) TaxID=259564 RepID=Q12YF5_METBU|nr:hypothetical protein [Methanococcoides burtonii]ABE51521.1 Hypothetical protein Mbur_0544 [Methanococcoides burtonii DSM 6242]
MNIPATTKYTYDLKKKTLHIEHQILAVDSEENEVGTCSKCRSPIVSLSYHAIDKEFIIVGKCTKCEKLTANIYDQDWNWVSEIPNSHFSRYVAKAGTSTPMKNEVEVDQKLSGLALLESIPEKQLHSVFSATEITAMFARAKGESCVRQYLYNARKKYQKFEDIFGFIIEV